MAVPQLDAATRLDVFLVGSGATLTRSQAKNWIDVGRVRVNGLARKAGFPPAATAFNRRSGP